MTKEEENNTNWSQSVAGLTKTMIEKAMTGNGFELTPYETKTPGRHLFTLK